MSHTLLTTVIFALVAQNGNILLVHILFYSKWFIENFLPFFLAYGQDICAMPGECGQSVQINVLPSFSYIDCEFQCQGSPNCIYFTYYQPASLCKLLSECSDVNTSQCSECYTGQRDCPVCDQQGECVGNVVGDDVGGTIDDCQADCYYDNECVWYTYDSDLTYCLLTSDCIPRDSLPSKSFGQKACHEPSQTGDSSTA